MRSGRFLQRLRKSQNRRARRKQQRSRAWHNARRAFLERHASCCRQDASCAGDLEAHDVQAWITLNTTQQNSIDFLMQNFRALCRHHHRQQHPHLCGRASPS